VKKGNIDGELTSYNLINVLAHPTQFPFIRPYEPKKTVIRQDDRFLVVLV
jgi:hypothetical protein